MGDGPAGASVHRISRPPQTFLRKYIFSVDHKMIGKQYFGLALLAVFTAIVLSPSARESE